MCLKPSLGERAYEFKSRSGPYVPLILTVRHSTPHFVHIVYLRFS
jgi:hypothetical protein